MIAVVSILVVLGCDRGGADGRVEQGYGGGEQYQGVVVEMLSPALSSSLFVLFKNRLFSVVVVCGTLLLYVVVYVCCDC